MDGEIVSVKEGDSVAPLVNISGLKPVHIRILQKCVMWKTVFLYCSPGEEKKGCFNITSPRISVKIFDKNIFIALHNVTTSDAGFYVIDVTGGDEGKEAKHKRLKVTVEPLGISSKTEATKPTDFSINYTALAICLLIAVGLVVLFAILRSVCWNSIIMLPFSLQTLKKDLMNESITTIDNETDQKLQSLLFSSGTNL